MGNTHGFSQHDTPVKPRSRKNISSPPGALHAQFQLLFTNSNLLTKSPTPMPAYETSNILMISMHTNGK